MVAFSIPKIGLTVHEVTGGNVERLEALLELFVELLPQYAHTAPRLRQRARLPVDVNPRFIAHQWLVDIEGQAAGMISFRYAPHRDLGLTVYVAIRPAYRQFRVKGRRLSEWVINSSLEQLQMDAQTAGRPMPVGLLLEVEPLKLVMRYREFGFVELPVEYHEPRFRQPRVGFNGPTDLSQVEFHRVHLGIFPIHPEQFAPTDPAMLTNVVLMFLLDHYGLPEEHWVVQRARHSIQVLRGGIGLSKLRRNVT